MSKTADFKSLKAELRGEREKNFIDQLFTSKKLLPFTLKRPAYSINSVSDINDQGPVSADRKFLTGHKFA
tara:strand:- start:246 stop:455 length:210 start_codon:yes stop_codon:yes gene_type:complete